MCCHHLSVRLCQKLPAWAALGCWKYGKSCNNNGPPCRDGRGRGANPEMMEPNSRENSSAIKLFRTRVASSSLMWPCFMASETAKIVLDKRSSEGTGSSFNTAGKISEQSARVMGFTQDSYSLYCINRVGKMLTHSNSGRPQIVHPSGRGIVPQTWLWESDFWFNRYFRCKAASLV